METYRRRGADSRIKSRAPCWLFGWRHSLKKEHEAVDALETQPLDNIMLLLEFGLILHLLDKEWGSESVKRIIMN